jgi:hypothetical protein
MSEIKKSLLPPKTILAVLKPLADMDDSKISVLGNLLGIAYPFADEPKTQDAKAKELGINSAHLETLLKVLDGLYLRAKELEVSEGDYVSLFSEYIERIASSDEDWKETPFDLQKINERLTKLITGSLENIGRIKKEERLRAGFIKNIKTVSTMVDLRPNYNTDYTAVVGWLEMIQFKITTDASAAVERDFVFQCDVKTLELLKKCIKDTEDKISVLKKVHFANIEAQLKTESSV